MAYRNLKNGDSDCVRLGRRQAGPDDPPNKSVIVMANRPKGRAPEPRRPQPRASTLLSPTRPDRVMSMTVVSVRRMRWTEADYLAFENHSPTKHEFLDGEIFAMAGTQPLHNRVSSDTLGGLVALLRGRGCGAFNSDQRIYIPRTGLYTYANGGFACGKWDIHTDGMCLLNPGRARARLAIPLPATFDAKR